MRNSTVNVDEGDGDGVTVARKRFCTAEITRFLNLNSVQTLLVAIVICDSRKGI